jgi:hypothetical protein
MTHHYETARRRRKLFRVWMDSESFDNGYAVECYTSKEAVDEWIREASKPNDYIDDDEHTNLINVAEINYICPEDPNNFAARVVDGTAVVWEMNVEMVPKISFKKHDMAAEPRMSAKENS